MLAAFDEPLPTTQHMGGKHAAPPAQNYDPKTAEAQLKAQDALIEQYRQHHAKQLPKQVPLSDHPFLKALQERIPCTKVKDLPRKEKPQ